MYVLPPFLIGFHNVVRQVVSILHDLQQSTILTICWSPWIWRSIILVAFDVLYSFIELAARAQCFLGTKDYNMFSLLCAIVSFISSPLSYQVQTICGCFMDISL